MDTNTNMNRRQFLKAGLVGAAGLLIGNRAEAQVGGTSYNSVLEKLYALNPFMMYANTIHEINWDDPILTDENIGFHERWREVIGPNRETQAMPHEFQRWVRTLNEYVKEGMIFTGRPIQNRTGRVIVDLVPNAYHPGAGGASGDAKGIFFNKTYGQGFMRQVRSSEKPITLIMLHEIGHALTPESDSRTDYPWAEAEASSRFIMACIYARRPDLKPANLAGDFNSDGSINKILDNLVKGTTEDFAYGWNNRFNLYMQGLIKIVGVDVLQNAVQSYHNDTFKPTHLYPPSGGGRIVGNIRIRDNRKSNAHEFFDRVAHFHDLALDDPEQKKNIPNVGQRYSGDQIITKLPAILLEMPEFKRNLTPEQMARVANETKPGGGFFVVDKTPVPEGYVRIAVQPPAPRPFQNPATMRPQPAPATQPPVAAQQPTPNPTTAPRLTTPTITPQAENSDLIFQQPRATFQPRATLPPRATTTPAPTTAPRPQGSGTFFDRR